MEIEIEIDPAFATLLGGTLVRGVKWAIEEEEQEEEGGKEGGVGRGDGNDAPAPEMESHSKPIAECGSMSVQVETLASA